MGFLGKEEGYREELQTQLQRWERKEEGKNVKDCEQPGLHFAHGHVLLHSSFARQHCSRSNRSKPALTQATRNIEHS